jgi:hypothetical protein
MGKKLVFIELGWSPGARRLGITSAIGIFAVGVCYVAVIVAWLIIEATPREPIGDPWLAAMEVLTILSALALLGLVIALWFFADTSRRVPALTALVPGSLAAALTMTVHFVQLTAVRQLWRAGHLPDYRLVWPSSHQYRNIGRCSLNGLFNGTIEFRIVTNDSKSLFYSLNGIHS